MARVRGQSLVRKRNSSTDAWHAGHRRLVADRGTPPPTGGDQWLHPTDVTETTLTVTGLEAGTTYQFRIFVLYWTEAGTRYRSGEADVTTTTPSQ